MFYNISRPTTEFPHPLSRVKQPIGYRVSSTICLLIVNLKLANLLISHGILIYRFVWCFNSQLSYQIVDALIWLGIRDLINEFRKKKLKLKPVTYLSGSYTHPFDVPHGYMWSPHLVPKPKG